MISSLERVLREVDAERSRHELRGLLGQLKVEADEREVRVYNEQGRVEAALLRAVGADAGNCGSGGPLWHFQTVGDDPVAPLAARRYQTDLCRVGLETESPVAFVTTS